MMLWSRRVFIGYTFESWSKRRLFIDLKCSVTDREEVDLDHEKMFFDWLGNHLGLKEMNDWYTITREDVRKFGGEKILQQSQGFVSRALQKVYPDHNWFPWKFGDSIPAGTWDNVQLQKDFMSYLGDQLKITRMQDWYRVSTVQIRKHGGGALLHRFQHSPSEMIMSIFPEHDWDINKFTRKWTPKWDIQLQRKLMVNMAQRLNINKMEDWYHVSVAQISENGGRGLLQRRYKGSPSRMITSIFPQHHWNLTLFTRRRTNQWDDIRSQRLFMDRLAKDLNITNMEDWYTIKRSQICEKGGGGLLKRYQNSPSKLITWVLPEYDWDLQRFSRKHKWDMSRNTIQTKKTWDDLQLQKTFLDHLSKELKINTMEDWYNVTRQQICNKGGGGLLSSKYSGSVVKMITSIWKDHNWDMRRFHHL
eukprot:TRINITY_DN4327_c0_g2_i1.p1 TRINITY_DN4327_c0_g2~~TRINITY_DN4327_c0_g2_i1.p1  ORF type:complete len:419 (+),score=55.72 TRINITY_DN4327_c0_g2_i1:175-1431(+)